MADYSKPRKRKRPADQKIVISLSIDSDLAEKISAKADLEKRSRSNYILAKLLEALGED